MDIIVLIIKNSHKRKEDGNRAVGRFEARLACIPAFNEGFRMFLQFARGYIRCPMFNGRERFCLIVLFVAAIGLDKEIIPDDVIRRGVLDACETAAYLAHLLRAEALPTARSVQLYEEGRRFLSVLCSAEFRRRQVSQFAIPKFRLLMYVINQAVRDKRAAPACSDSGVFESALRFLVSRIAHEASGGRDLLRDIAEHDDSRMTLDLLRTKSDGSDVARSIAEGCPCPVRSELTDRCLRTRAVLEEPLKESLLDSEVAQFVRAWWQRFFGDATGAMGSSVEGSRVRYFAVCHVYRAEDRFAAPVRLRQTVLLDHRTGAADEHRAAAGVAAQAAACADPNESPETAKLARVVALFYLPPPDHGLPPDGLAVQTTGSSTTGVVAAAAGTQAARASVGRQSVQLERMFVVVHPFDVQSQQDKTRLKVTNSSFLRHHAIRRPMEAGVGKSTYAVLPVSAIRRAVRVQPLDWPSGAVSRDALIAAAKCETGPVLVFWEPRDLWLPTKVVPQEEHEVGRV